jgi:hypothetical protein
MTGALTKSVKQAVDGPIGVALAQLINSRAFAFGCNAHQDAYRIAIPPLRGFTPPGEYLYYPVKALAPDESSGLEILADMYRYRLIDIFGHHTPLLFLVCGWIIVEQMYYCQVKRGICHRDKLEVLRPEQAKSKKL